MIVRIDQGNLTGPQLRGIAQLAADGGRRPGAGGNRSKPGAGVRSSGAAPAGVRGAGEDRTGRSRRAPHRGRVDVPRRVLLQSGADQNDESGRRAAAGSATSTTIRRSSALTIKASGCPNACGHHWIGDIGFYGNARKIEGKEVPYYQMLLGGGYDETGIMRFGLAVQSIPARLAPEAVSRVLDHFLANRLAGESFRDYVVRHKVETFRALTSRPRQTRRTVPRAVSGLGRRGRVLRATRPRRVRAIEAKRGQATKLPNSGSFEASPRFAAFTLLVPARSA